MDDDDDQGAESSEVRKRLTTYAMLGRLMGGATRCRVYLSGPITGVVHYRAHFDRARTQMEAAGHTVINPADIGERDGWDWADYMRGALQLMLAAQGVALLPGWEASRGARMERTVALELGMDVRPLSEWLAVAE